MCPNRLDMHILFNEQAVYERDMLKKQIKRHVFIP